MRVLRIAVHRNFKRPRPAHGPTLRRHEQSTGLFLSGLSLDVQIAVDADHACVDAYIHVFTNLVAPTRMYSYIQPLPK